MRIRKSELKEIIREVLAEGVGPAFSDAEYTATKGKEPRGRGNWFFFFDGKDKDIKDAFRFNGDYKKAKKAAYKEAQKRNATRITLGA